MRLSPRRIASCMMLFALLQRPATTAFYATTTKHHRTIHYGYLRPFRVSAGQAADVRLPKLPLIKTSQSSRLFLSTRADHLTSEASSAAAEVQDQSAMEDIVDSDMDANYNYDNDTIFALSSGSSLGQATAVAVIRISGPEAATILQQLSQHKPLPKPRMAVVRDLRHPTTQSPLDQALVLWFPGPHSFTGQDIVELHCHGSRAVVESVLQVLAEWDDLEQRHQGDDETARQSQVTMTTASATSSPASTTTNRIRLADPGEFTKRAWQSGKLNLLQVEALADLLVADTSTQRVQALKQLSRDSSQSNVLEQWRLALIGGLAHAEAVIDFGDDENLGDDDDGDGNDDDKDQSQTAQWAIWGNVRSQMQTLCQSMEQHLYNDGRRGELVRNGLRIAIVGPPNAGKSSLLNLLAQREAAIVSPMAGTTRDVVEVALNLGGVKCLVQDTAGLRRFTDDVIEQKGMERAAQAAAEADMVLIMVDGSGAVDSDTAKKSVSTDDDDEMNWLLQSVLPSVLHRDTEEAASVNLKDDDLSEMQANSSEVILVTNKSDLKAANGKALLAAQGHATSDLSDSILARVHQRFDISCVTQTGVDNFLEALTRKVLARVSQSTHDEDNALGVARDRGNLITRTRHRQHVQAAVQALERFDELSGQGSYAVDMAAEELRLAASELGRITGAVDVEDVLDKLFADFCIGK